MKTVEMLCPHCQESIEARWRICAPRGQPFSSAARNLGQALPPCADSATILENRYDQSWAVVIGINDYKKADPLQFAVPDAEAMPEALRGLGFARERVFSLLNADATRQNIQDLLCVDVAKKAGPNDRLFVFLAGHGQDFKTPSGQTVGYFIPVDGDSAKLTSHYVLIEDVGKRSK